ncbi:TylF/MycF/NovP-related O-methyltransferase [Bradyrhizobium sp. CCBAU 51745]|uniref:TylF/MycF/NovP-related O-methyltransferase n=1 Tax=Bradyrhizobium sp. CCBAU 51745 TaxID=1325099 RepID=UPI00230559F3|nr:TylF/MycF/NovP-related O-methyltransferase [Bradyrhizobium sp. CCBAU 51745]
MTPIVSNYQLDTVKQLLKRFLRTTLRNMGLRVTRIPTEGITRAAADGRDWEDRYFQVLDQLKMSEAMRDIHRQDAAEIEQLYRRFLFTDLPVREGRSRDLSDLIGTTVSEAIYVIKSLHDGLKVAGDICEFGVAQGATSKLLASEIMPFQDRKLWLFDSFEGLPAPTQEDRLIHDIFNLGTMANYKGTMASPETEVLAKLASINFPSERIKVKKGWVRDAIKSGDLPAQVAFAYVDFDFYEPIKDALEFLDARMPVGGRIVVDDYGYFSEGAQLAVDQFVQGTQGRYKAEMPLPFAGHFCMLDKVG